MAASKIGGWVASALISNLVDKVCSYLGDQYEYQKEDTKNKMRILKESLLRIQEVIHKAERLQGKDTNIGNQLRGIKDAAYQAEDVLDLFDYRVLEAHVEVMDKVTTQAEVMGKVTANSISSSIASSSSSCSSSSSSITTLSTTSSTISSDSTVKRSVSALKRFLFSDEDLTKLASVVTTFNEIDNRMKTLLELLKLENRTPEQPIQWRRTTSMLGNTKLFGRVSEGKRLQNLLMQTKEKSSQPYDVIAIVGIAGVGKTALVQKEYSYFYDKQEHFDFMVWLHVSDKFDVERLTKEMVQSGNLSISADLNSISSLDQLQRILKDKLKGIRILVVLDDVWNEMSSQWETLCKPLQSTSKGSKVIVTTRSQNVANMNGATVTIHLDGLKKEDYWGHFSQCAFHDANPSNFPKLEYIGRQLVKKLAGSPLAAKTVGNLLKMKPDEDHWRTVSERKLWQIEQKEDDIIPALRLSYEHLPDHLKQCITYFSLFPKNYQLPGDVLIHMWRAHGFVNKETPDEAAYRYIDDLLQISFIRKAANLEDHYVVHDLLHDFAESVSNGEHFRIEHDFHVSIPTNVRHLYVNASNISIVYASFEKNIEMKENLRSLIICKTGRIRTSNFNIALEETLKELRNLRVLVLRHPESVLPNNVQHMVHLRYLDIKETNQFTHLPTSLFGLYHLQALSLQSLFENKLKIGLVDGISRHKIDWQAHIPQGIPSQQCKEKKRNSIITENLMHPSIDMCTVTFYWPTGSQQKTSSAMNMRPEKVHAELFYIWKGNNKLPTANMKSGTL
uniref:NB-ARC domain-containing protein n=1 Tax=Leersia perrieri TaxID=77586 RepID=A0A0D9W2I9_9ORYZ